MEWVKGEMEAIQQVYVNLSFSFSLSTKFKGRVQNFDILGWETGS